MSLLAGISLSRRGSLAHNEYHQSGGRAIWDQVPREVAMRRFVGLVLMGGVLAVAAPSALAQKKPGHVTAGPKEFKLLGDFMAQAKEIPAELRSVDEKKGKVVVRIENTVAT